jgi:hypothetical protein
LFAKWRGAIRRSASGAPESESLTGVPVVAHQRRFRSGQGIPDSVRIIVSNFRIVASPTAAFQWAAFCFGKMVLQHLLDRTTSGATALEGEGTMTVRLMLRWTTPKKGETPFRPIAHIVSKSGYTLDDGMQLLTADCMNAREIDEAIDLLIFDLESIRKEGHKKFWER